VFAPFNRQGTGASSQRAVLALLTGLACFISLPSMLTQVVAPALADTIPLETDGGAYSLPVLIDNAITLKFVLDTGASDVLIPGDVVSTLIRAGAVEKKDFIGTGTYTLADGSKLPSARFIIRELKVGGNVVKNVTASVAPVQGTPLLGQSFLSKLPRWTIDYKQHVLIVADTPASAVAPKAAAPSKPPKRIPGDQFFDAVAADERGDPATALRLLRPLAERGDALAQVYIGTMYERGDGVPQDLAEALRWYRKAAEQGEATAETKLGSMYFDGKGIPQDYAAAATWYRKAANQGDADAENNLGSMYFNGSGVPKDHAEAMSWYRKAAQQGNAYGQFNVGRLYTLGDGVPQDHAEAAKWYRKAAEQGYAKAQMVLGGMYVKGQGLPEDYVRAHMWVNIAASRSSDKDTRDQCIQLRELVARLMSPAQIAEAQRLAQEWKPK
jgi:uncharacterized protein